MVKESSSTGDTPAIAAALDWLQGTVLGTVATSVAIIAVASVGFLLLTGRVDVKRGVTVILGCFVLFGSSTLAVGILDALHRSERSTESVTAAEMQEAATLPPSYPAAPPKPYDPYAGAALRPRS